MLGHKGLFVQAAEELLIERAGPRFVETGLGLFRQIVQITEKWRLQVTLLG